MKYAWNVSQKLSTFALECFNGYFLSQFYQKTNFFTSTKFWLFIGKFARLELEKSWKMIHHRYFLILFHHSGNFRELKQVLSNYCSQTFTLYRMYRSSQGGEFLENLSTFNNLQTNLFNILPLTLSFIMLKNGQTYFTSILKYIIFQNYEKKGKEVLSTKCPHWPSRGFKKNMKY